MADTPLTDTQIEEALRTLPGWGMDGDALARTCIFSDFREAMAFMARVGQEAEELNHHPDWSNVYNRVSIRLNTHDAGGRITAKDVELARRIEGVLAGG